MKGVIFNIVEDVVVGAYGETVWDSLLEAAGLEGAYTSLGSYEDAELMRLVEVGAAATGHSQLELQRVIGRQAMPLMAERWPEVFAAHRSLEPFLRSLNSVIHPEVHKLYPGARCPHFDLAAGEPGELLLGYKSPRRLCHLAQGFVEGAADHYHQTATIRHPQCMHEGDPQCLLAVAIY